MGREKVKRTSLRMTNIMGDEMHGDVYKRALASTLHSYGKEGIVD